jgi:hypothetical protein
MSETIYILTVLFFVYVINVVLGDDIALYMKNAFPKQQLKLPALQDISMSNLKLFVAYLNRNLKGFTSQSNHRG